MEILIINASKFCNEFYYFTSIVKEELSEFI